MNWVKKKTDYSQIEEKRRILNIVFANFFMEGKNPVISMRKNFNLLSKIGGCQDWCSKVDELLESIIENAYDINNGYDELWDN